MQKYTAAAFLLALFFATPLQARAEEPVFLGVQTIEKAKVIDVSNERTERIPGTDAETFVQVVRAEIMGGEHKGQIVQFTNDYVRLSQGDFFFLRHTKEDGTPDMYSVADPYRLPVLLALGLLFLVLALVIGGMPGLRGLASLAGGVVLIFYLLLPGILAGYSPVLVAIGVSSLIIVFGSYITHGFNRTTSAAVLGMVTTVSLVGALSFFAVHAALLTGYASHESTYLTFESRGSIDLVGLVLAGIMIGLLGVLYDIAIGQAVAVEELLRVKHDAVSRKTIYARAVRIGREHIGALVNTLAIAYVGASLPLLLLFRNTDASLSFVINSEVFATEIIRVLIGSIGLILAVPVTTFVAVYMIREARGEHSGHYH